MSTIDQTAREGIEIATRATKGPVCIDSVGEKHNEYIVGVAFASDDEECERPLSGWLEPQDGDDDGPYCDEKVCETESAENASMIAHAFNHHASLCRAVIERGARVEELERALRDLMWRFEGDDEDPHEPAELAPDILQARKALAHKQKETT